MSTSTSHWGNLASGGWLWEQEEEPDELWGSHHGGLTHRAGLDSVPQEWGTTGRFQLAAAGWGGRQKLSLNCPGRS